MTKLLTYSQASELLGVPIATLYSWVSTRRIPHIRFSKRTVRFAPEQLKLWADAQRVAPRGVDHV